MSDFLLPHGLYSPRNSSDQNTGVGSHSLLQEVFPTQGLTPGFLHRRWILYQLSYQGSPSSINFVYHVVHYIPSSSLFTAGSLYLLTTLIHFPFHLSPASGNTRSHLLLWVWFLLNLSKDLSKGYMVCIWPTDIFYLEPIGWTYTC